NGVGRLEHAAQILGTHHGIDARFFSWQAEGREQRRLPGGGAFRMPANGEDAHAERERAARDLAPDRAVAEKSERPPVELVRSSRARKPAVAIQAGRDLIRDSRPEPARERDEDSA